MKNKIVLIIVFFLMMSVSYAQSKKELAKSIQVLENEVVLLKSKTEMLQSENVQLSAQVNNLMSLIIEMNKTQIRGNAPAQNPATTTENNTPNTTKPSVKREQSAPVSSSQCQATTKKGTQCSRRAQPGRSYCWQH